MSAEGGWRQIGSRVWRFDDVCAVYAITSGSGALLIELGSGAGLDRLHETGAEGVDWVLHTHHHRDLAQGYRGRERFAEVAVPVREAPFLRDADHFWQELEIDDRYDCAHVFNTPVEPIPVTRVLADYETFEWEDLRFEVLPTPGHTRGAVSYLVDIDGSRWVFCGDLIHSPGRVWTLYDLHWDYSNPDAVNCALHSARLIRDLRPDVLAPAHGEVMDQNADAALELLDRNLRVLHELVDRRFAGDVDVPVAADLRFERVSEHLITVSQTNAHFHVLRGRDGGVLFFDYGFPSYDHVVGAGVRFAEHSLNELAELGVGPPDVVVPTHYHDDHVAGFNHLVRRFGTKVWGHAPVAEVISRPLAHRLPAAWHEPIALDRVLELGEPLEWGGWEFEPVHVPGHTWHAVAYFGEVDGQRVCIIGDEIQLDASGKLRGGGPVYRNGLRPRSFTTSIAATIERDPQVLLTGHDGAVRVNRDELEYALDWARELERCFERLAAFPDAVGLALDADFLRFDPYRSRTTAGSRVALRVAIRNHFPGVQSARVSLVLPAGWTAAPEAGEAQVPPGGEEWLDFQIEIPPDAETPRRYVVTAACEFAGIDFGEVHEALVEIGRPAQDGAP